MKKVFSYLLVGSMIFSSFSVTSPVTAFAGEVQKTDIEVKSEQSSTGVHVTYRTQEEIRKFAKEHPYVMKENDPVMEKKASKKAPYLEPGKPSKKNLETGLNALNLARYVAGLNANVTLDESYNQMAQAAAYVNAINDKMTHDPTKPAGMDETMYQLGAKGCGRSNLGKGYTSLSDAVIQGWLGDGDASNVDRVGHRRWVLNPSMGKTGFGYVDGYFAMYAFDGSGTSGQSGVAWPAQNMPIELVSESSSMTFLLPMEDGNGSYKDIKTLPWSYSYGKTVDPQKVQVTLTRERDQKQWKFSKDQADGNFFVNNEWYGQTGCIIFQPANFTYYVGDTFHVEITGLEEPVSYDVTFFSLDENAEEEALKDWNIRVPSRLYVGGEVDNIGTVTSLNSGNAAKFQGTMTVKSLNPSILKVKGNQLIPKKPGKATIQVTYQIGEQKRTLKSQVVVKKPYLKMTGYRKQMSVGSSYRFQAKQEGLKGTITYSVSNKKIAKINKTTGQLKALKKGKVTVIAKLGKRQAKVNVTIK